MIDLITIIFSLIGALIGASLGPFITHKFSIKYFKKKHAFIEKIKLYEKIGGLSWSNHLALTILEQLKNNSEKEVIRATLKKNIQQFIPLLEKGIYFSRKLVLNLGRDITLFEKYVQDPKFGTEESIKNLRKDYGPFSKEISDEMGKELGKIK